MIHPSASTRRLLPGRTVLPAILLSLFIVEVAEAADDSRSSLTLVSRSAGLSSPDKEEGHTELEIADLNGDGHLDIVTVGDHGSPYVNSGEHGITVWLGNGAGTWTLHQSGNFGYGGCAAGDLNRDGKLDLAWGIHHDLGSAGFGDRILGAALGNGSGSSWTPWGSGLATSGETWGMFATALADFDGNGRLDLVSQSFGGSNGLRLYENHGDGTWSQAWAMTGGSVGYTLETCDVNADGHPDIVSTRSGTNVLLGNGAFGFTLATSGLPVGTIRGIHVGDVDNDGDQDLSFAFGSAGVRCYLFESSSSTWVAASSGLPTTGTFDLTQLGDLDGDGFLDLVCYADPTGRVFLGNGGGSWTADVTWTMPSPGDASALRVDGDVDHDGREDILIMASKSGFPFYRNQLRLYSPWLNPAAISARVVEPLGGECFRDGSIRDIRWLAAVPAALGASEVEIRFSSSGPAGPWTTLASGLPDNGRFEWKVDAAGSDTCRIEVIVSTATQTNSAISAENFRIIGDPRSLQADSSTLSGGAGGTVNFTLDAGVPFAGRPYLLIGGMSGTSPGTLLPGGLATVPINRDWFTDFTLQYANTPLLGNFAGVLSGGGTATAQLVVPPLPAAVGLVMHYAFVTSLPYDFASNAVEITVGP
jgi:hypothetical protein